MQILQKQCRKQSRRVTEEDMERVKKEAAKITKVCRQPHGRYPFALALAHCQLDHADPLRFFVFNNGRVIINPKITEFSGGQERKTEGCFSYAFRPEVSVKRWNKIKVSYTEMDPTGKTENKEEVVDGMIARVFQHELDHMNGKAIYH